MTDPEPEVLEQNGQGEWVRSTPTRVGYAGKAQDGPWLLWFLRKVFRRDPRR